MDCGLVAELNGYTGFRVDACWYDCDLLYAWYCQSGAVAVIPVDRVVV